MIRNAILFVLLFCVFQTFGQIGKKSWMVDFNFKRSQHNFSYAGGASEDLLLDYDVRLQLGYFIFRGTVVGLDASFKRIELHERSVPDFVQMLSIKYFARQYFNPGRLQYFALAERESLWVDERSWITNPDESNVFFWRVGLGANYFLADNVALESTFKGRINRRHEEFGNWQFDIGLQFFLNRKEEDVDFENLSERYFQKGNLSFEGNLNLEFGKDKYQAVHIAPSARYLFSNNREIEVQPYFIRNSNGKDISLGISNSLNLYFPQSEKLTLANSLNFGFEHRKIEQLFRDIESKAKILHVGFSPQLWYFFSAFSILKVGYHINTHYLWNTEKDARLMFTVVTNKSYSSGLKGRGFIGIETFLSNQFSLSLNVFLENFEYEN